MQPKNKIHEQGVQSNQRILSALVFCRLFALRLEIFDRLPKMQRWTTFLATCVVDECHACEKEPFHWVMALNIATQVAGMMLHCATIENFVAALQEMLSKVELFSTSRNRRGNKKLSRNGCGRACYTGQFYSQL